MADKQTLYFPCPSCGARFAQVEETGGDDIHAGETYTLQRVRRAGGAGRAQHGDAGRSPASIRWNCHFCKPGPCRLAPSSSKSAGIRQHPRPSNPFQATQSKLKED